MSDFVVSGNSVRWGAGHDYMMRHLDENVINLMYISNLNMQVHHFPSFAESIRKKCCSYWLEEDDETEEAENMHEDQGSFNACVLMDVPVFDTTRFGSRPACQVPNQPIRSNACID